MSVDTFGYVFHKGVMFAEKELDGKSNEERKT